MRNLNTENVEERLRSVYGSNTRVLSFKNMRRRLNSGLNRNSVDYITSKQLNHILLNSNNFTRVSPQKVGCYKWFDEKQFNERNKKNTDRVRNRINLWSMS